VKRTPYPFSQQLFNHEQIDSCMRNVSLGWYGILCDRKYPILYTATVYVCMRVRTCVCLCDSDMVWIYLLVGCTSLLYLLFVTEQSTLVVCSGKESQIYTVVV